MHIFVACWVDFTSYRLNNIIPIVAKFYGYILEQCININFTVYNNNRDYKVADDQVITKNFWHWTEATTLPTVGTAHRKAFFKWAKPGLFFVYFRS